MPPKKRYDVFLSHSSADKPAVEEIARKLLDAEIVPFLDKWHLIPGDPWQEALEKALDQSRTCAVFLGPGGIRPWQNKEMRSALEDLRVIPVLLPGSFEPREEELPRFLRLLTWVDFRAGLNDENAFHRLLAGIKRKAPGPGPGGGGGSEKPSLPYLYRSMAPPPEGFVHRREYDEVLEALCPPDGAVESGTSVGITTALRGAGGFGKTALAQALCQDPRVRQTYPDGILWTTMGEEINDNGRLAQVRDLIRWWTEEKEAPTFETLAAASARLRELLANSRVLVVVDDVWSPADVNPFQGIEKRSSLLITTRDRTTLPEDCVPFDVDAMASPEAVSLLRYGLPEGSEREFKSLATGLGEWPLLLKLVNRQLQELVKEDGLSVANSLMEIERLLAAEGFSAFNRQNREGRNAAAGQTIAVSIQRLPPEEQERYLTLAVFPEDADVPLSVLERFWKLSQSETQRFCRRLHGLSLLLRFDWTARTARLHDVIRQVLVGKAQKDLPAIHERLLDSFRPERGQWADLPQEETYLWRNLAYHLEGAGFQETLRELLADFSFLQSKLAATDINALIADYTLVQESQGLRLIQGALRLSAHVLVRDRWQLAPQLIGRLANQTDREIQDMVGKARSWRERVWLRPRAANFTEPGGPLIRILEGHSAGINGVAALDDRCIISASDDGTLRIWDLETGQTLRVLEGHLAGVITVVVLDSQRAISASADGTLRLWDIANGQTQRILEGHSARVTAVAVLNGGHGVSASTDGTLRLWNLETGQTLQILKRPLARVTAVAVLDGQIVVTGYNDGKLQVWNLGTEQILCTLEGHSDWVTAVAVVSGRILAASADGTLRLWDLETGQTLCTLEGHSAGVTAVTVLDSRHAISASGDGTLRMWDLETGQTLYVLEGHLAGVTAVALVDGRQVVSASADGTLRVQDLKIGQSSRTFKGHAAGVTAVVVLDSQRAISASTDGTMQLWDLKTGHTPRILEGHLAWVTSVVMLDDHRAISSSYDQTLRVWNLETGQVLRKLEGHSDWVFAVAVLDGQCAVSASTDKTLRVWDLETGQTLHTLIGHSAGVFAVAILDDSRAVSASFDGTLRVWDLETGKTLQKLEGHSAWVRAVAVLDNRRAVSASTDRTLRVWDLETGKALQNLEGHTAEVSVVVVLEGDRALSASFDGTLRMWDLESGEALRCLEGHSDWIRTITLLNGCRAVSTSDDRTLQVWNLETGKALARLSLEAEAWATAVSPDGRVVVAGDRSGRVHFFDLVEPE